MKTIKKIIVQVRGLVEYDEREYFRKREEERQKEK